MVFTISQLRIESADTILVMHILFLELDDTISGKIAYTINK